MNKIIILTTFILTTTICFGQSTFRADALNQAITQWVNKQVQRECDIQVITKLTDIKLQPNGVKATIEANNNLIGDSDIDLVFKEGDREVFRKNVRLKVRINFTSEVEIKKNDAVQLYFYSGGILIKARGIALDNGKVGEIIKVRRDNKQVFYGLIAEDGNIIIDKDFTDYKK